MTCIRYRCQRRVRAPFLLCDACLECVLYGGPAICTPPEPAARPGPPTAPVGPTAPWSELELLYRFGR